MHTWSNTFRQKGGGGGAQGERREGTLRKEDVRFIYKARNQSH